MAYPAVDGVLDLMRHSTYSGAFESPEVLRIGLPKGPESLFCVEDG